MKIRNKITIIVALGLMISTIAICSWTLVGNKKMANDIIAETYRDQLDTVKSAIEQEANSISIREFGSATHDYFVGSMVDHYGVDTYMVTKADSYVSNQTGYQIDIQQLQEKEYQILKTENQQLLIINTPLNLTDADSYILWQIVDVSIVYSRVLKQLWYMVFVCTIVLFTVSFCVSTLIRKHLIPLDNISQIAHKYGMGDFKLRIEAKGNDEIASLGNAFNRMANQIEGQILTLKEINEKQKLLMGSMAHEWKTPITAIVGYADTVLYMKPKKEQMDRILESINRECHSLEKLSGKLEALIGLYNNDAIEMKLQSVEVLLIEVKDIERFGMQECNMELLIQKEKQDIRWNMDEELMKNMIVNILNNAIRASKKGQTILLTIRDNGFSVRDYGCGIPETEIDKIKEAFYMVDKSRDRKKGGSGLGLAICEEIATLHNGKILITSKEGNGTTVEFRFV